MKFIIKPRGYGKTEDLIRLSKESHIPIVTAMSTRYYPDDVKVFTVEDLISGAVARKGYDKVYIDEADSFLVALLEKYGVVPELGTMTL